LAVYEKHTLLIDVNAIGYAAQQATKLTSGGMETQAAFGVIKSMRELRQRFPQFTPVALWDGRAEWRFKLHPDYKSNRTASPEKVAMKEAYAKQKPYIEQMLEHLGVRQITAFTHEADDMAGLYSVKLSKDPKHRIGLITGDQDWLQLVRENVFWTDLRSDDRYVTAKNFYDFTGCKTPLQFLERKCLTGDTSDVIGGVGGLGKDKGAPELIAQFGSVREFWRQCDSGEFKPTQKAHLSLWKGESPFTRDEWAEQAVFNCDASDPKAKARALKAHMDNWPGQGRAIFRRNFQLMQLLRVTPPRKEDVKSVIGKLDPDKFGKLCDELAFRSITANLDEFTNQFKQGT
jgi:5'-3' exonuclease